MFLRAMVWKELREQRLQALLLTVIGVLVLAVVFPMFDEGASLESTAPLAAIVFAWAGGMVTGAISLANERETHAQEFLDTLPRSRREVWFAKLFVPLLLVGGQGLALTIASATVAGSTLGRGLDHPGLLLLANLLSGLYGLGCGLCGSAIGATVLTAIGWSLVVLVGTNLMASVAVGLLVAAASALVHVGSDEHDPLTILAFAAMIPLPLALSGLVYSRVDRQRRYELRLAAPRFRLASYGLGLRHTLWLSYRQGGKLVLGLIGLAAVGGALVLVEPLVIWPATTMLIGLLMGVGTLGDEQYHGSFKLLADQRLPLGRFWLFKTASRFLVAVGLIALAAFMVGLTIYVARGVGRRDGELRAAFEGVDLLFGQVGLFSLLGMWGLYGFVFGHAASLLARKSVVALAIALAGTVVTIAVWVPALVSGGLPDGQLLVLPVGVLVGVRLFLWAWATERLLTRGPLIGLGAGAVLAIGFLAFCQYRRVADVPKVDVPLAIAEFEAGYLPREKNTVRANLIQAEERLRAAHARLAQDPQALRTENGLAPATTGGRYGGDRVLLTLAHGWPAHDAAEQRLGEQIAAGDWSEHLLAAAAEPPTPVELPRDEPLVQVTLSMRWQPLGPAVAFAALYRQAMGRHGEALDLLAAELACARHLMTRATHSGYLAGLSVEAAALLGLTRWSESPGVTPELLARALKEVQRHEALRPNYGNSIKAEYLRAREYQGGSADAFQQWPAIQRSWKRFVLQTAVLMPIEKARRERLLNAYFDMLLKSADIDFPTLHMRIESLDRLDHSTRTWLDTYVDSSDAQAQERARELSELIARDLVFSRVLRPSFDHDGGRFVGLCQARGLQLQLALRLYRHRHGRPAASLEELVPEILPAVPIDPFCEAAFRYRVLQGAEWLAWDEDIRLDDMDNWGVLEWNGNPVPGGAPALRSPLAGDTSAAYRRVLPGTGLVWSVGPDGGDDRARRQYQPDVPGRFVYLHGARGQDLIFLIPEPRSR